MAKRQRASSPKNSAEKQSRGQPKAKPAKLTSGKTRPAKAPAKKPASSNNRKPDNSGRLKIGDDWNAIRIIALSQSNPLKAIAEFVENSIDAGARRITISKFRQRDELYLSVQDDGRGVPLDNAGEPDFRYVATHICDSLKRQIKQQGQTGIQGEFGIGLLSFWTIGQNLSMICPDAQGRAVEMQMSSGNPQFNILRKRSLLPITGTKLTIGPLLSGIRHLSGDKIHWYLAGELRDRIRQHQVQIQIIDRIARAELNVVPREFQGQPLRQLPSVQTEFGECQVELYLTEPSLNQTVGLSRFGTRVLESITQLEPLQKSPWDSGYFAGVIDAPFLNLTPGTRLGIVHDDSFSAWLAALRALEQHLQQILDHQRALETERASRDTFKSIQRAFREALLALPEDEYDWFDIYGLGQAKPKRPAAKSLQGTESGDNALPGTAAELTLGFVAEDLASARGTSTALEDPESPDAADPQEAAPEQLRFFEHAGPLYSAKISPTTCVMRVETQRTFQVIPRDKARREVLDRLSYQWRVLEGHAAIVGEPASVIELTAPSEPQLIRLGVEVTQTSDTGLAAGEAIAVIAEAIITVTDSVLPERSATTSKRGLPDYTFDKQPGQLWRSRLDADQNLIIINSGHRDFVHAAKQKTTKLRYICRLFGKELVLQNFPGLSSDQLLERFIELGLYTEEHLK